MQLLFGMPVVGADDVEAGTLDRVLADPQQREITHLVVQSPRLGEDVLVPISLVQGNVGDRLLLHAPSAELEALPRYDAERTSSPPSGRVDTSSVPEPPERQQSLEAALNLSGRTVEFGPGTRITTADQLAGSLVGLATDVYTNRITELQVDGLRGQVVRIAEPWIGVLGYDTIAVSATSDQLDHLVGGQAGPFVAGESARPSEVIEGGGQGR